MFRNARTQRISRLLIHSISTSLFFFCLSSVSAQNQTQSVQVKNFTRIVGPEDGDLAVPGPALTSVQRDPSALQVITAFLTAANSGGWGGMQATGTLTSPGKTEEQYPATLTVKNGDSFRLDVSATEGQRSLRIQGQVGAILESNGVKHTLPPATALGGFLAFPRLMMATFPGEQTSVLDQGIVVVEGKSLHRITIQEQVFHGATPPTTDQPSIVDLYFDPATHLLVKSVALVQLDTADRARYMQAITYSEYQSVNSVLLPFAYSQTLNGQRQWSLQLANVQLDSSTDTSLFIF
jgi:hypothetical protein